MLPHRARRRAHDSYAPERASVAVVAAPIRHSDQVSSFGARSWSAFAVTVLAAAGCGRWGFAEAPLTGDGGGDGSALPGVDADPGTADAPDASGVVTDAPPDGPPLATWTAFAPTYPGTEQLWGVFGFGASDLWVAGGSGVAQHFDGTSWTSTPTTATDLVYVLWGASPDDVWLVGRGCTAVHWTGAAWAPTAVTGCTNAVFNNVNGASATDVWAVGSSGQINRWNGSAWADASFGNDTYWDTWIDSPTDVYIVGTRGTIVHWNGTYTNEPGAPNQTVTSVTGVGGAHWAVGFAGLILYKPPGGAWTVQASPTTTENYYDVLALAANDVWAVGSAGTIVHYDGASWSVVPSPTTESLRAISRIPGGGLRIAGDAGTVLTYP